MRLLIISLFVSAVCFGQKPVAATNNIEIPDDGKVGASNPIEIKGDDNKVGAWNPIEVNDTPKIKAKKLSAADSLLIPVFSTKEVYDYLTQINKKALAIKGMDLSKDESYLLLVNLINKIVAEMDKKRKGIK